MRKELEAAIGVLQARFDELQDAARQSHGPLGRSWLDSYISETRRQVREARAAAAAECRPATPEERCRRVADAFTR